MKRKNTIRQHKRKIPLNARLKKLSQKALLWCVWLLFTIVTVTAAHAESEECNTYSGSNLNAQEYSDYNLRWTSPMESFLVATKSNEYVKVQANAMTDKYLIEYYDAQFNLTKTVKVAKELNIFGGFYYDGSSFYILSGQKNTAESDSVEVYRLTKYDATWTRKGAASLYGANTYIPFDAGSARMDHDGNLLFIRTCHEMYMSSDGNHHQANVTIEVNTSTMTVVDSYCGVMNSSYGYISHSFNQFIKLDGGKIVGVDHGDANPRSVALLKYTKDYSASGFTKSATCVNLLSIPGDKGDNDTGVCVGGFEISTNNYLVAGNTVEMGDSYDPFGTRNIFVISQDRSLSSKPVMHKITNYSSTATSPSTPHLVKISDSSFLVLWMKDGVLNYCKIDGSGNKVGSIYTMSGCLSDCQPIVNDGKVLWYTWKNELSTFYSISTSDISKTNATEQVRGHKYDITYATKDNATAKRVCSVCGYSDSFTTMSSFNLWWRQGYSSSSQSPSEVNEGTKYSVSVLSSSPSNAENKELEVTSSNSDVIAVTDSNITCVGAGKATVTVAAKYRPSVKYQYNIVVKHIPVGETTVKRVSTCTTPGKAELMCSYCDKIVTEDLPLDASNHTYDGGTVTKEPTCKTQGTKAYTCEECSKTKTEAVPIDTTKHKWNTGTITTVPTCTTVGEKTVTCSLCSKKDTIELEIDPDNHAYNAGVCSLCQDVWTTTQNGIVYQAVTKEENGKLVGVKTQIDGENRISICVVGVEDTSDKKLILPGKISVEIEAGTLEKCVVTTIASNVFEDSDVTEVVIPETVTELEENALEGVSCVSFNSPVPPAGIASALESGTTIQIPQGAKKQYADSLAESDSDLDIEIVENVKVHEHDWSIVTVIVKPTTTTPGLRQVECSVCGENKEEVIDRLVENTPQQPVRDETGNSSGDKKPIDQSAGDDTDSDLVNVKLGVLYQDGKTKFVITNLGTKEAQYVGCTSKTVKAITIPATVTCEGVVFKVTSVKANALKGYKKATKIVVGKNVKKIGNNAFSGCKKLKTLTIKSTKLTSSDLSKKAFAGITKSTKIVVPKSKLKAYKKLFKKKGLAKSVKVVA